jgi:phosphoribosylamine--glycine ligase
MRILVVGSGGREHALVWKLRQSRVVREVLCAPGNDGMGRDVRLVPVSPQDHAGLAEIVRKERVDYVIVGPEGPLAAGLVDYLQERAIRVVGPVQQAARLESSKAYSKEFMARHGIPTAAFTVHDDARDALRRLNSRESSYPLVVKADGLAAGKGVIIARTQAEAQEAVRRIMVQREFGMAGDRVVLEEFIEGIEASFIVFTDGETVVPAVTARDHKAVFDNDEGPNTGGMGAYSTDDILGPQLTEDVLARIVNPVIRGMQEEGNPFRGFLYTGLMLSKKGPQVLEFNARMGDPEGQVILPRLESDFALLCSALSETRLKEFKVQWKKSAAVCVVLASDGYPGEYSKGKVITGLEMAEEDQRIAVFHAGTRRVGADFVSDGGRVLGVTAVAEELSSAVTAAYEAVNKIHFEGMHYRRDIGARGLA